MSELSTDMALTVNRGDMRALPVDFKITACTKSLEKT